MSERTIAKELERIATVDDFESASAELTEVWADASVGTECIEPILRFLEKHPDIDFGMPGSLVHFVEEFYGKGYEKLLVESLARKPTVMTVWMLNRVINAVEKPRKRDELVCLMKKSADHPKASQETTELINELLG